VSLVRQDDSDLENSECGENLTRNGRKTYMSGDIECIKERYVRVAAIITATIDGIKNNCLRDIRKQSLPPSVAQERTYQVERV
jgi:hypothetical protein